MSSDALATAAFIDTMTEWYEIISSRKMSDALWKEDKTGNTRKKVEFLSEEIIPLIQQLVPVNSTKTWLPAMSSILICTKAVLTVYDIYVINGKKTNYL
jgi:hypothetical protein